MYRQPGAEAPTALATSEPVFVAAASPDVVELERAEILFLDKTRADDIPSESISIRSQALSMKRTTPHPTTENRSDSRGFKFEGRIDRSDTRSEWHTKHDCDV